MLDCYSDVVYHYPTLTRQVFLWNHYHFDCQCPVCLQTLLQDDDHDDQDHCTDQASDDRRSRLHVLAKMLAQDLQVAFLYTSDFDHQVTSLMDTVEEDEKDDGNGLRNGVSASETVFAKQPPLARCFRRLRNEKQLEEETTETQALGSRGGIH